MNHKIFKEVLITEQEIQEACKRLAKEIEQDYKDDNTIVFLGLLKGCHPFMGDLLKQISYKVLIDYMDVSSYYGETTAQTEVQILKDMTIDVADKNIIIVEDIVDTGRTIQKVSEVLMSRGAKSVEVVTMADKPSNRKVVFIPKYIGKEIANEFVLGYGLDYNEYYRNLPEIGIPKDEIVKGEK